MIKPKIKQESRVTAPKPPKSLKLLHDKLLDPHVSRGDTVLCETMLTETAPSALTTQSAQPVNAVSKNTFGARAPALLDSGACTHACDTRDAPEATMQATTHPGFRAANGSSIPAKGKIEVCYTDNQIGKNAVSTFIVGENISRPLMSTGEICDKGNLAIYSNKGAIIVDEKDARYLVAPLIAKAKLSFRRTGFGALYEFNATLHPGFTRQVAK